MALSPEAETWLDETWPIGGIDEAPDELAARLHDKGWRRRAITWTPLVLVSPGNTAYTITQTSAGLRAQRTT